MSRAKQTYIIIGAVALAALFLAIILKPDRDLSNLHPVDRCDYRQYYRDVGGSVEACKEIELNNAARRLRGGF